MIYFSYIVLRHVSTGVATRAWFWLGRKVSPLFRISSKDVARTIAWVSINQDVSMVLAKRRIGDKVGIGTGKSMCISEVHGGAGLGCGPASAHYIAEQVLGYGFFKVVQKHIMSRHTLNLS